MLNKLEENIYGMKCANCNEFQVFMKFSELEKYFILV